MHCNPRIFPNLSGNFSPNQCMVMVVDNVASACIILHLLQLYLICYFVTQLIEILFELFKSA